MLQRVQLDLRRFQLKWSIDEEWALKSLIELLDGDEDLFLDVVDWQLGQQVSQERAEQLQGHLASAGSVWTIGFDADGVPELQRRVDPTATVAAQTAAPAGSRAAVHMARGWSQAYGRDPSPSEAYRESVRAVEAAGKPVVSPVNERTTLGTMIYDMRAKSEKWTTVLTPSSGNDIESVVAMMGLLWTAQLDRHGTPDDSVPLTVSQEEAEAAVHLAASLVQLFSSGAIQTVS